MEAWIDHPNVTAVVWGGLPSSESGDTLVDILYGRETPSGKLPYTIARNESDYYGQIVTTPEGAPQINYTEGVFIDYRYFTTNNISVRYPFGYGLSYTTFGYEDLDVIVTQNPFAEMHRPVNYAANAPGGDTRLFETVVTVTAKITNTGDWHGREVVQLYLGMPAEAEEPRAILRGFQDITLDPGDTGTVRFELRRKDVSYWNVVNQRWDYAKGEYIIYVGASSEDFRLQQTFSL
jgi:beta-glucosidase